MRQYVVDAFAVLEGDRVKLAGKAVLKEEKITPAVHSGGAVSAGGL